MPSGVGRVLDYGCGVSPYRTLFGDCIYHRADFPGGTDLDFTFDANSMLPSELAGYDCVLSTQVLEHVADPTAYLKECYRVLKRAGYLLLTTHGLYEDHPTPQDYWRWTVVGLRKQVEDAGFKVEDIKKLTTGPRAALFLAEREILRLRFEGAGWPGYLLSAGVLAVRGLGTRRRHKAIDLSFAKHRVVNAAERGHDMYVAIAILASRGD
jgi:SAM-dependent methyltransferase